MRCDDGPNLQLNHLATVLGATSQKPTAMAVSLLLTLEPTAMRVSIKQTLGATAKFNILDCFF
jgi:hypothetical protein